VSTSTFDDLLAPSRLGGASFFSRLDHRRQSLEPKLDLAIINPSDPEAPESDAGCTHALGRFLFLSSKNRKPSQQIWIYGESAKDSVFTGPARKAAWETVARATSRFARCWKRTWNTPGSSPIIAEWY
jgi:hypothetical protein